MVIHLRSHVWTLNLLIILVLFIHLPIAYADRGGFSPIGETVSESGQKAIIAWNGTHEILILSTDVSSSNESEVMEIMPLPSNPAISKGEIQSFLKIEELVNTYFAVTISSYLLNRQRLGSEEQTAPKITITFQEIIGVHYLTVVTAEETSELIQWLENFLEQESYNKTLPSDMEELLSYYMQNGMKFFVIDIIKTNATVKTIDPLIYEFKSSKLYYPLRISTLFSGYTEISLFTITNNLLSDDSLVKEGFVKKAQFQIKQETLAKISSNITQFFSSNPCLCYFRFSGLLAGFKGDVLAVSQSDPNLTAIYLAILSLGLGLIFLLLFFPTDKIGLPLKNTHIPMVRRLEIALLFAGLMGIFFTWTGCFLPWGLAEYGKNGEVLIALSGLAVLFILPALILTPLYFYSLLVQRDSKEAFWILTAGGAYMMLQALISNIYCLYASDIGVLATTMGCAFIILAGLISFWHAKIAPIDALVTSKGRNFKTYIVKRFLIFIVTLIGISIIVFLLWYGGYILPPYLRLASWT